MAVNQRIFEHEVQFESEEDVTLKKNWKSISTPTQISNEEGDCFDCNICLDSAHDPVATLCGHLYCWPCIYKWLHVRSSSPDANDQQPKCPVCKANISSNSLVPLYGRGPSESKRPSLDSIIPQRPPPSLIPSVTNTSNPGQQLHLSFFLPQPHQHQYFPDPYGSYGTMASSNLGSDTNLESHDRDVRGPNVC